MENQLFDLPAVEIPAAPVEKPARKPRKPKEPRKVKVVYREPELSDRQKKYQEWLSDAIRIKQKEFQNWPTHMEVQGARVYKQAGDLMASCTDYKGMKKQISDPEELLYQQRISIGNLMTQCCRNIAANIRFLERLSAAHAAMLSDVLIRGGVGALNPEDRLESDEELIGPIPSDIVPDVNFDGENPEAI